MPLISVILPVYNGAAYLAEALESLTGQTESDFECIAVDDGSTDATPDILTAHSRRDPRLRVETLPHRGIVAALNHGLARARGDLIARMDADDRCHPMRLALQKDFLARHPEVGLVASRAVHGGDEPTQRGYALYTDWSNTLLSHEEMFLNRFVESPLVHPTVMFRASVAARHGGYRDGAFAEDYELWLRWFEAGVRMEKLPRNLLVWRDHGDRISRLDQRYARDGFFACKAAFLARWLHAELGGRQLVVWGAGRKTRKRMAPLTEQGVEVHALVDIDPAKIGRVIQGRPVWPKERLPEPGEAFVLPFVAKRGARELIRAYLESRGYELGRDFLPVA